MTTISASASASPQITRGGEIFRQLDSRHEEFVLVPGADALHHLRFISPKRYGSGPIERNVAAKAVPQLPAPMVAIFFIENCHLFLVNCPWSFGRVADGVGVASGRAKPRVQRTNDNATTDD